MAADRPLVWQPSLLAAGEPGYDASFSAITRRVLSDAGTEDEAWVDHQPAWVHGADDLFAALLETTPWRQRVTHMYDRRLPEPRMTARWMLDEEHPPVPLLEEMAVALGRRYGVRFTQVGVNLYRDGADSVAWHGDRVARELPQATVALVSLGAVRPFRLRPKGGGRSIAYLLTEGDLLVLGGSCQRTWDHAVPKVRQAGPRISIQLRHAYDR